MLSTEWQDRTICLSLVDTFFQNLSLPLIGWHSCQLSVSLPALPPAQASTLDMLSSYMVCRIDRHKFFLTFRTENQKCACWNNLNLTLYQDTMSLLWMLKMSRNFVDTFTFTKYTSSPLSAAAAIIITDSDNTLKLEMNPRRMIGLLRHIIWNIWAHHLTNAVRISASI